MILTGSKIKECVMNGDIEIKPFNVENINPNSYNYIIGDYVKVYVNDVLDAKVENKTKIIPIPDDGLVLEPNKVYLGFTKEIIGSDKYVPVITGRSSTGRLGLFVQITSDLVDIGFHGHLTLQMHAVSPVRIYKNMKIGQIMFWCVSGDVNLYNGKYQGADGPRESETWRDFK